MIETLLFVWRCVIQIMRYISWLWLSLLVIPQSVLATGHLEVLSGQRSYVQANGLEKNKPITVDFDLCVASVVWSNGWQPEPFWVSIDSIGNAVGYMLETQQGTSGSQSEVQVKFSFLNGNKEIPISEGQMSTHIVSKNAKNHCNSAFGYTLRAELSVANQSLLSDIYLGEFVLRLHWGQDNQSPSVKYTLSVQVPHTVKITGLSDLLLVDNGSNQWVAENDHICVYAQTWWGWGTARYVVTADGAGVLSKAGSSSRSIPYLLRWSDAKKASKCWHDLDLNTPMNQQRGSKDIDCVDGRYSAIRVEAAKVARAAGLYTDTVTLTITPE